MCVFYPQKVLVRGIHCEPDELLKIKIALTTKFED